MRYEKEYLDKIGLTITHKIDEVTWTPILTFEQSGIKSQLKVTRGDIERLSSVVNVLLKDSGKTDIDSQIKAIETLNENLIKTPLFISIIASLKELRGIKRNFNR